MLLAFFVDIRFLKTFLEVVQTRHFGRAAENLYLTQSAVSARIKLLEEYFNTPLFIRNRNSIQITPAGERLIPFAKKISNELALARQVLAEQECVHVSISATQTAMLVYLDKYLSDLFIEFSNISIRHNIISIEQMTKNLHEHSVDLGVSTCTVKSDDVESILLGKIKLALCHKDSITDFNDNDTNKFINIDYGKLVNEEIYKEYPTIKKSKVKTSSLSLATELLNKADKVAIIPMSNNAFSDNISNAFSNNFNYSLLPENCHVPIFLNKLKNSPNQGVDAMVNFLIEQYAKKD